MEKKTIRIEILQFGDEENKQPLDTKAQDILETFQIRISWIFPSFKGAIHLIFLWFPGNF